MFLQKLTLANFKNYDEEELEFCKKINCFVGENGEGKTNILDAIHYLSFCKSYFNSIDSQNIRYTQTEFTIHETEDKSIKAQNEPSFFSILGVYQRNGDSPDTVQCVLKRNHRKIVKFNKKEYERLSEHIGLFPLVMISPFDSNMIYDGSEERRKYIDGVISQFDKMYLQDLISYNKALEQRNKLLKQTSSNKYQVSSTKFDEEIEIWDEQLIKYGQTIFEKRLEFIENLIPIFREYYKFITGDKEKVGIEYDSQLKSQKLKVKSKNFNEENQLESQNSIEENQLNGVSYRDLLKASINKDRMFTYTTAGIHKDDIVFNIEDRQLKKFGSQGQQKSFLIALKLAQFDFTNKMKGYKPILLFDDIFDKLDDPRVEKLINLVSGNNFGQIFITETHKDRILKIFKKTQDTSSKTQDNNIINGDNCKIFEVKKGKATIIE